MSPMYGSTTIKKQKSVLYNNLGNAYATIAYKKRMSSENDWNDYKEKATENYNNALKLDENPTFYANLGWMYYKLKDYHDATIYYKLAINLYEEEYNYNILGNWYYITYSRYYDNLGVVHYLLEEWDLAIEAYTQAIALQPSDYILYMNTAAALIKKQRYDLAKETYEKASKHAAENSESLYDVAIDIYNQASSLAIENSESLYELAIGIFEKAIKASPNTAKYCYAMGQTYEKLRQWDNAIKSYDEAISPMKTPDEKGSKYASALVEAYRASGRQIPEDVYHKAIEVCCKSTSSDNYFYLGWIYLDKKEYQRSLYEFNKAIELYCLT